MTATSGPPSLRISVCIPGERHGTFDLLGQPGARIAGCGGKITRSGA
jgi:hypothetical protein